MRKNYVYKNKNLPRNGLKDRFIYISLERSNLIALISDGFTSFLSEKKIQKLKIKKNYKMNNSETLMAPFPGGSVFF